MFDCIAAPGIFSSSFRVVDIFLLFRRGLWDFSGIVYIMVRIMSFSSLRIIGVLNMRFVLFCAI